MRTAMRRSVVTMMLCLAIGAWAAPAAAQTAPFKVYITELWQLDDGVDPGIGMGADYFATVTINGVSQDAGDCDDEGSTGILVPHQLFKNFARDSSCDDRTPWVVKRNLAPGQTVTVKIQVFDEDTVFNDEADLKPGDGDSITLQVDPVTGHWSGDVTWPSTCSRPGLSLGGNNANVCFQMGFDTDDDGLLDVWEQAGVDTDNDGVIDLDIAAMGAHPLRKDIFLEIDHLQAANHSHRPMVLALTDLVTAFANAPTANPDGTTGIQIHVDAGNVLNGVGVRQTVVGMGGAAGNFGDFGGGNAIPELGNQIIEAFEDAFGDETDFADLRAANFNSLRETVFRYAIFGHQTNARRQFFDCTSGVASRTRRDFMITLGGFNSANVECSTRDPLNNNNNQPVGSRTEQAGTLMHELGHTLGLRHGGNENVNNKPNYLSVMNYNFQDCDTPPNAAIGLPGGCDYSRLVQGALVPDLDELNLDECAGIGVGLGPINFNGNTTPAPGSLAIFEGLTACAAPPTPQVFANTLADTNNDGVCVQAGDNKTLDTQPVTDDAVKEKGVNDGFNRVCDTAKEGDDTQKTAVGNTPSQPQILKSFDDWAAVTPSLFDYASGFGTGSAPLEQEPDRETLRESKAYLAAISAPKVSIQQSGPATAKPGDLLTYTAKATNAGSGPALSSVLTQTRPDATAQATNVDVLTVGGEAQQTTTFTVPADACPGTFTGASAALSFKDLAGTALTASASTPLQILDVAAPTFDLSLSPDVLWSPDHKMRVITATVTVKDNCDPNPIVTLVSITSNEAATGVIGSGDQGPDVEGASFGTDDRSFSVRSERATGLGRTGRVYTVTYRVADTSGNATVKTATVTVPTSQAK